jgi:hypothetical protein
MDVDETARLGGSTGTSMFTLSVGTVGITAYNGCTYPCGS